MEAATTRWSAVDGASWPRLEAEVSEANLSAESSLSCSAAAAMRLSLATPAAAEGRERDQTLAV